MNALRTLALAAGTLLLAAAAHAQTLASPKAQLGPNQTLGVGQFLMSPSYRFFAIQQSDGNFCVYEGKPPASDGTAALWCHMAHGASGAYFTIQQTDGNFCTYKGSGPADNKGGMWCSQSKAGSGQFYTTLQDDGNLCTYPTGSSKAYWCTMKIRTSPPTAPVNWGPTVTPTRGQLDQWITQYAPVVYFHSNEQYFATSVEGFQSVASRSGDGYALRDTSDAGKAGNLGIARAYVNAKVAATTTDLQYWFLYAYNGAGTAYWKYLKVVTYDAIGDYSMAPCGQHEGDWEHIAVRVDNRTGQIVAAYLSQHDGGAWFQPGQSNLSGGRVTFYASRNGHAAYWQAGRDYGHFVSAGIIEFRLLNDTNGNGKRLDTRANGGPVLMAVQGAPSLAFPALPWMSVNGRWGRVYQRGVPAAQASLEASFGKIGGTLASLGTVKLADIILDKSGLKSECEQEAGPTPPWTKGSWVGPDN